MSAEPPLTWAPIAGFPGYEVSSRDNRVRRDGRDVAVWLNHRQYLSVRLQRPNGTWTVVNLHRVVLESFDELPGPVGHQVNHKNGEKADCDLTNLEWMTPLDNVRHAHASGIIARRRRAARAVDGYQWLFNVERKGRP